MDRPIEIECRPVSRGFSDRSVRLSVSYGAIIVRRADHPALIGRRLAAHGGRYVIALGEPAPLYGNVRRRPFASLVAMPVAAYPAEPAALAAYRAELARNLDDEIDVEVSHGANLLLRAGDTAHDFQLDCSTDQTPCLMLRRH